MRAKLTSSAVVAGVLALTLAACSSGTTESPDGTASPDGAQSPDGTAEITFLTFYDDAVVQELISTFEATHEGIKVNHQTVPFADLSQTIETRLADGSPEVDVIMADQPRIAGLYNSGFLADLTDDVSDTSIWFQNAVDASTIDGKLVAVPTNTSTAVMFYNADLLSAAGIELPTADPADRLTWDQIIDMSRQVQAAGGTWGVQFDQVSRYYQMQPLVESPGGGSGLTGDDLLSVDVTNEGWVEGMSLYSELFESGISPRGISADESPSLFVNGETAFYIAGTHVANTWEAADVSFDWGIAPHPYFADGEPVTPTGSWSIGVNPNSDAIDAAKTFALWIATTPEGAEAFMKVDGGLPAQPQALDTYLSTGVWSDGSAFTPGDLVRYEVENTAVNRPRSAGYIQFEEIIGATFEDIRNGVPVTDALQDAQDRLVEVLGRLAS